MLFCVLTISHPVVMLKLHISFISINGFVVSVRQVKFSGQTLELFMQKVDLKW